MATLLPFPTGMLSGFVKKSALFLPAEHRSAIFGALNSKQKPNVLLEKTKIIVVCILSAKQEADDDTFQKDVQEALAEMKLSAAEYALFDGLLGAKQGMLIEFAKKGVTPKRLEIIRSALVKPTL